VGGLAGLSGGMIAMTPLGMIFSFRASVVCLVLGIVIAGGAVFGGLAGRREVYAAEFTGRQVRLVSSAASRTVEISDLDEVAVEHSGDTDTGYARTSLRLRWPGETRVTLVGDFDPELARSLGRMLGPGRQVRETWKALDSPPGSA
jgi:hypothetical protein